MFKKVHACLTDRGTVRSSRSGSREDRNPDYGVLLTAIIVLQFIASLAYPVAKYGLAVIEPFTFAFFRFMLASVVLLAVSRLTKHNIHIERRDWPRIVLLGILIIPLNQTLFLVGQSMTTAGHGSFLFATTPIWIFILALIHLREQFLWRRACGIVIAVIGVAIIITTGAIEMGRQFLVGDLIILVSVVAWGYYTVLGKPLMQKYGAICITAYSLIAGSIIYFPFGLYQALHYDYSQSTLAAWGTVAYMAIGLSLIVYVLWAWVLKYMEASRIAVYHNVQPVIATLVAWFWLDEQLGIPFIVGGAIVLSGVIITEV